MTSEPEPVFRPVSDLIPQATPSNAPDVAALSGQDESGVLAAAGRDIAAFFADDGVSRQDLDGFEELYADIVHYIIRCTHRIWEDGGIGLIYSHYTHNCPVHTSDGTSYGRDQVVAMTARALAAYPDIQLVGDDVVWSGNAERGFHASHRMTHVGTNHGWSGYGEPTGRPIRRKAIAHCVVKDNRIVEEWLARDELAAIRSMGLDERRLARDLGAAEAIQRGGPVVDVIGDVSRGGGQLPPSGPYERPEGIADAGWLVVSGLQVIWNERRLDRLQDVFANDVVVETSTNVRFNGHDPYRAWLLRWLAAFSDVAITFEHVMTNERVGGTVVATRWRLDGTHTGPGPYGDPTGRRIRVLGFSHHLVQHGLVTAEWSVFDEFSLLKQLLTPDAALRRGRGQLADQATGDGHHRGIADVDGTGGDPHGDR